MKRMRIGVVAVALLAAASTAMAQPPPAQPAPDPHRLQLAREIMQANGGAEALQARLKSMFGSIAKLTQSMMPATAASPQGAAMANALMNHMEEEELKAASAMIDDLATVYAEHLTVPELQDLLAYTRSPSAQSIRAKMPAISEELLLRQAPLIKRMTSSAVKTAVERTCEESHCTPEQRQALNTVVEKVAPGS
ncbi:MAG TPA: DUF2059 domain-containing protein [Phenylobacterium sp.]|jgi:hypothetical protein|uniref:DUF2059 domain-containing protein n=1 Tax=Phenylobacterium sp. TaxID=1871053 RepID=UPI002B52A4A1|nr:DUF2059 domain-containing protein [Phenylobacterium sp.]HXA38799.1 DUF2059 domain-containing protein [Phenylobacterium sp.]